MGFGIQSGGGGSSPTGKLKTAEKDVTTAGTQVALGSAEAITEIIISAKNGNTGFITVEVSGSTAGGVRLDANDTVTLTAEKGANNLADIFIDASVNGEGVDLFYSVP